MTNSEQRASAFKFMTKHGFKVKERTLPGIESYGILMEFTELEILFEGTEGDLIQCLMYCNQYFEIKSLSREYDVKDINLSVNVIIFGKNELTGTIFKPVQDCSDRLKILGLI